MTRPTFDVETADRAALINWLLDDAERRTLEEWAGLWLNALSGNELREWVRDALPFAEPDPEPLPPTRQLTDTERAVLRGMLP